MSIAISRMQFLRGDYSGRNNPIRPPWALREDSFRELCERCGDCIDRCPTHIIQRGRGDFPVIDYKSGECVFCGDCVDACKPAALKKLDGHKPWSVTASVNRKNMPRLQEGIAHELPDMHDVDPTSVVGSI